MKAGSRAEVSAEVPASPEILYRMIADVERMGDWSPECRHCEWIGGATGPVVGARFKGRNRRGPARWTTKPRVIVADYGREFAFVTGHLGRDMTKWSYRFGPCLTGTKVTESFEMLRDMPWYFRLADRFLMGVTDRRADLESNMAVTLGRVHAAVEEAVRAQ